MHFENIVIVVFALAVLVFVFARRRVIKDLKADIEIKREQLDKLRTVALRQRVEIDKLMQNAEAERRAHYLANMTATTAKTPSRPPPPQVKRRDDTASGKDAKVLANTWNEPSAPLAPIALAQSGEQEIASQNALLGAYGIGNGGSFDGGGASGDYDRPNTSSACSPSSDSSASSDSGSSSSSDSGCSSSFND